MIHAIWLQADEREMEVIAVDDGSSDGSPSHPARSGHPWAFATRRWRRNGAAAAINKGVREARYPIICQVDQDVVVEQAGCGDWSPNLKTQQVAAAQGYCRQRPAIDDLRESDGAGPRTALWGHR